jgi:hypothetical protein
LDISEASGPTGAPRPPPARPALGSLAAAWAPTEHAAHNYVAPPRDATEANDRRSRQ